jgi:hypothetical protein
MLKASIDTEMPTFKPSFPGVNAELEEEEEINF